MKSKSSIVLFTLVFIIIIGLISAYFILKPEIPQTITGSSTLSISEANLESNGPYLTGKQWILTFTQGRLGQTYFGDFQPREIEQKTPDGSRPTHDFTITVNYDKQQCVYPIGQTNLHKPVYELDYTSWTYVPLIDPCNEAEATSRGYGLDKTKLDDGFTFPTVQGAFPPKCYQVYWKEKSPIGSFGNTDLRARMNINVEAEEKSGSISLDTEGSTKGPISDFAYAVWQGNLVSGQTCSYTTDNPFKTAYVGGRWRVISENKYSTYLNNLLPRQICGNIGSCNADVVGDFVNEWNFLAEQSKISQSFGTLDNEASLTNAIVREDLQAPLQGPVITMYVKAATLGIYTPTPELTILRSGSDCFKTGEEGIIELEVKNTGNEDGVWDFYAVCNDPFDVSRRREYGVPAGQTRTITLPLSADATQRTTGTCTIYAEGAFKTEQIQANVCVDPQQTCRPNELFCASEGGFDIVKQCSANGATSTVKEICAAGENCIDAKCTGDPFTGGFWDDLLNKILTFFRISLEVFPIILGIIGAIAGFIFSRKQFSKAQPIIHFIVAVILGIITYFLAKKYWYLGLLLIIVYIILSFKFKKR